MTEKTVLCYGDSITWGYNPANQDRIPSNERWPGVLGKGLGHNYRVIEEGLNGRTTVWDDPLNHGFKNGLKYLIPCLDTHKPVDLCILLLGTNDMKKRFSLSAIEIARGIMVLVNVIQKSETGPKMMPPKILLMTPPYVSKLSSFSEEFENAYQISRKLPELYSQIASDYGCEFLDTSQIIVASDLDGVHPDLNNHIKLGKVVLDKVKEIME
jgi:lysophospholipase L1-like esterase